MKLIRQWLAATLGTQRYLQLISKTYIRLVKAGFFKSKYPELFYLDQLIKKDFVCIDLGANVGYYSTRLAQLTENTIYAVEPVALFREVLQHNLRTFTCSNVEIYPYALGSEEKKISMGTPVVDGVFRHGLTKVMDGSEQNMGQTYEVDMKVPDVLFSDLQRLDYVKCDVEGYETFIFPHFTQTLSKFKPVIQIEISSPDNRKQIADVLLPMGYRVFALANEKLIPLTAAQMLDYNGGDFYFSA